MFSTISPVHTVLRRLYHERCSALFHLFTLYYDGYITRDSSALFHLFTLYYDGYITRDVQHYFTCSHCITTVISLEMFSTISPVHTILRQLYQERCSVLFHLFTLYYDGYITRDVQHYLTCSHCITTVISREMFSTISPVHTVLRRLYHERCSALFHLFTPYYDCYITRDVQHYFTCSHCITTVISRDVQHYFTCSHCITTVISREMFSTISPVHTVLRRLYYERCSALFHLFTLHYDGYITRDVQHYFTCSHCITTVISREMFSTISPVHTVLRRLYHERCSALFHLFTLYYDGYIMRDVQHYFTCSHCITTVISREMFSTISPVHTVLRRLYHERCSALFHLFTLHYDGYITRDVQHYFTCSLCITRDVQHYFTCSLCITTVISREMFSTISPVHSVLRRLYHERCSALFHLFTLHYDGYITRDVQHYFTCSLCITRDVQHYFTCSHCITTVISREMFSTI